MAKRLIQSVAGVHTFMEKQSDGKYAISTVQDVAPILEESKDLQNLPDYTKGGIKQSWMHLAHIPNQLMMKWCEEDGFPIEKVYHAEGIRWLTKKVHERDNAHTKVAAGYHVRKSE